MSHPEPGYLTDSQRIWRWLGRRLLAMAIFCFQESGATFDVLTVTKGGES